MAFQRLRGEPVSRRHRGLLQKKASSHTFCLLFANSPGTVTVHKRTDQSILTILIINLKGTREATDGHAGHLPPRKGIVKKAFGASLQRSHQHLPTLSQFQLHLLSWASRVCMFPGSQQLNLWLTLRRRHVTLRISAS